MPVRTKHHELLKAEATEMMKKNCTMLVISLFILGTGGCTITSAAPEVDLSLGDTLARSADDMLMIYVPAGEFEMGSTREMVMYSHRLCRETETDLAVAVVLCSLESFMNEFPPHAVRLDAFWIDRTEVSNQQYQRCVEAGACTPPGRLDSYTRSSYYGEPEFAHFPVIWVTHAQAAQYCEWAVGRLPTEAEWEYAARGPGNYLFPWGNGFDGTRLNYCDVNCPENRGDPSFDDGHADTAPVGSYPAGASWCGALDMAGNVREWVAEWYGFYSLDPQVNPQGPLEGTEFVPRGGCWLDVAENTRSTNRGPKAPNYSEHKMGFRCAADLEAFSP